MSDKEQSLKTMLDWALFYHENGFNVIPISAESKKPLVKFADKQFTKDDVIFMWTSFPNANIAITTDKVFVVDIDVHDPQKSGFDSIKRYEHKDLLIPTLTQETASGGQQMLYFKRPDMEIRQVIGWLDSVDIKASQNNYFLVPPSRTAKGQYKWLNKLPIVTAPRELIKEIMKKSRSNFTVKGNQNYSQNGKSRTTELFEMICYGLGEKGARNDKMARFIGGLLYRNVSAEAAYYLAQLANRNTPEPLNEKELEATFESIFRKDMRRRGTNWNE